MDAMPGIVEPDAAELERAHQQARAMRARRGSAEPAADAAVGNTRQGS